MASTSTTAGQAERESTSTEPFPSTSVMSSSPSLCSSCFDWVSSFIPWRSSQSNSMASPSTAVVIPDNEGISRAFDGIAPSASTSTAGLTPDNDVTGAFDGIAPSASTSTAGAFDGIAPFASTSASTHMHKPSYDVFINHRGPDVKSTLATILYAILTGMTLSVFLDSEELEYGDFFPRAIEAAITSTLLHIAIFSKKYAESPWCLAELSIMLKSGATIIPIFYHVDPNDLRWVYQGKGTYAKAFEEHEKKGRYSSEQLHEWKMALHKVSFYTGEIIKNDDDQARLLKNIVSRVLKEIKNVPLTVAKHPVGLEEIVEDFEVNTLRSAPGNEVVQIVGIWGMGGSGKTTLARELYNKISSSMDRSSFLSDVRDAADKKMLREKQIKLLNDLGEQNVTFANIEERMGILSRRFRSIRVLIVLDDVDRVDQLDALLPAKDSLGRGSLIIVTSRACDVLKSWGISSTSTYKMKPLNPLQAEQLFCWHAFLQSCPLDGFKELVEKFLKECHGLPLSLKVIGAQLYGESRKEYWESELHKIQRILPDDIKERLKISYDALDDEEKEMFLDSACFFIGEESSLAIEVWNGLGWSGLRSWERLLHKCLVELDDYNCIKMHDHLKDLGRDIANQQSPYRLWSSRQIINVQKQQQKRIGIQGIMTTSTHRMFRTNIWGEEIYPAMTKITDEVDEFGVRCLHGELMVNTNGGVWSLPPSSVGLRFLMIEGDNFNEVMGEVSGELVWLRWIETVERNLPSWLSLKKLRVLELYNDRYLEELWGETDGEVPVQLRQLIISQCYFFQGFPNSIGRLNHLKKIVIIKGTFVRSLPDEFCLLQLLEHLVLCGCTKLSSLPDNFGSLRNLRDLSLAFCCKLRRLPVSFKNLVLLEHLNLEGCSQLTFTSEDLNFLENITKLEFLNLSKCEQLEELPPHITNQASLRQLCLDDTSLRELPDNIGQLSRLREMSIHNVLLTSLPTSLGDLSSLTNLSIWSCPKLECLPDSLGDLSSLTNLEIEDCPKLERLGVKSLPKSIRQLNNLQRLTIVGCPISELDFGAASLPFGLSNLKQISLYFTEVCRISFSEDCCPHLRSLHCGHNDHLEEIEALPRTVESMDLLNCNMLKKIPSFARLTSIREFKLRGCDRIEKIEGLEYCTRLESLEVESCWEAPGIESMEHMEKLRKLILRANKRPAIERCIQTIQKWPDEIQICTPAVPDASSVVVDSLLSLNLVVVDSFSNNRIKGHSELVQGSFNGDAIMLCFFINCVSSKMTVKMSCPPGHLTITEFEKGKWALVSVFTPPVEDELSIVAYSRDDAEENEVEKGLVVRGEKKRLVEVFQSLLPLL